MPVIQNTSFPEVLASAFKNHAPKFTELIMDNNMLFSQLAEKGLVEEKDGGATIVEPLMFNVSSAVGSYSGYDLLDVSPQQTLTAMEMEWKQVHVPVTIDGLTTFKNMGKSRIIDLGAAKIKQAEISLDYYMDQVIFGDGTNNGGKDITGLGLAIEDGAAWSTYGGINSNTYSQWRNQYIAAGAAFSSVGLAKMRTMYNSCSSGKRKPTLIVTTQTIYEAYESTVSNIYRSTDLAVADLGYKNLMFKETPIVFDDNMNSQEMLFINSDFMKLIFGKGKKGEMTPFQRPVNQDAKVASMFWYAQLICNHRRRQGRITTLS